MKILGVEFAPFFIPLRRRLQTAAVLYYYFNVFIFSISATLLCFYLLFTRYYILSVLYIAWLIYDRNICKQGGRKIDWMRNWTIWKYFRDYFPIKMVKTAELSPDKNYIIGYHPHGIICASVFCNFATEGNNFSQVFPGMKSHVLTLESNFWIPLYRELVLATGTCSASKESIEWLLTKEGKGQALILVIGGVPESLKTHPGPVNLILHRRKGFVKLALKHGVSLVPTFSFGENDLFKQVEFSDGSLLKNIQNRLTKILGFSFPILYGRGIFQYNMGFLPYRKQIVTVIGKPIDLEKSENPSNEEIEKIHEIYINSLKNLFEEHKDKYGYSDRKLIIL